MEETGDLKKVSCQERIEAGRVEKKPCSPIHLHLLLYQRILQVNLFSLGLFFCFVLFFLSLESIMDSEKVRQSWSQISDTPFSD